jgi:hypothetical protein
VGAALEHADAEHGSERLGAAGTAGTAGGDARNVSVSPGASS